MKFSFSIILLPLFFFIENIKAQNEPLPKVDELPYFAGCDTYKAKSKEKKACSMSNLTYFLSRNLIYPDSAKQRGINGVVYVSFLVEKTGAITAVKLLNDIGGGCGEMAKKVVMEMPFWEAAVLNGEKIDYELRLPIKFTLEESGINRSNYQFFWGDLSGDKIAAASVSDYYNQALIVRNSSGEKIPIVGLTMVYENGKILRKAKSKGNINRDMVKILKKTKIGGKITFLTTMQNKGVFFEIYHTFNILETLKDLNFN